MLFSFFVVAVIVTLASANMLHVPEKFVHAGHTYESKKAYVETGKRCRTKDLTEQEMEEVELHISRKAEENEKFANSRETITIQVFWHVIKNFKNRGKLSDVRIGEQIQLLNNAYGPGFTFNLMEISNTVKNNFFDASFGSKEEGNMKKQLRHGNSSDLNIYTNFQTDGTLGWATFPNHYERSPELDGVVVDYRTLSNGGSDAFAPYNEGITLVHEVGHWMGLYHTFQGGCVKSKKKGDRVGDTPAVASPNFGCPSDTTDSCPGTGYGLAGNDLVHNYMDYGDDACLTEFTPDQKRRMRYMWNTFRK
jgi:hypothetical protein